MAQTLEPSQTSTKNEQKKLIKTLTELVKTNISKTFATGFKDYESSKKQLKIIHNTMDLVKTLGYFPKSKIQEISKHYDCMLIQTGLIEKQEIYYLK